MPGAKVAQGVEAQHFSVEDIYHEKPLGYHVRNGGNDLPDNVWKYRMRRKNNFNYCPELALIMPMKLERQRCMMDNGQGHLLQGAEVVDYGAVIF